MNDNLNKQTIPPENSDSAIVAIDKDEERALEEYDAAVKEYFALEATNFFSNKDPKHARIVIRHILFNSRSTVDILTNSLSPEVENVPIYSWNKILDSMEIFFELYKKSVIRILIRNPDIKELRSHPLIRKFQNEIENKRLIIKQVKEEHLKAFTAHDFLVADCKMLRFEGQGQNDYSAQASSNAPDESKRVSKYFSSWFESEAKTDIIELAI